jgi:hypothetical protein
VQQRALLLLLLLVVVLLLLVVVQRLVVPIVRHATNAHAIASKRGCRRRVRCCQRCTACSTHAAVTVHSFRVRPCAMHVAQLATSVAWTRRWHRCCGCRIILIPMHLLHHHLIVAIAPSSSTFLCAVRAYAAALACRGSAEA